LTLGVARVLNLAHGTFFLGGAYLGWWLITESWTSLVLAVVASSVLGGLVGVGLAGLLVPLRHQLDQALATIGVSMLLGHGLTRAFGPEPLAVDPPTFVAGTVTVVGQSYPVFRLAFIAVALGLALGLWLLVARSRPGMAIRATADDPEMATCVGISPARVRTLVVVVGAAVATAVGRTCVGR
jgi:branched-subunit amino acid ABC-type transport system permease component